MHKNPYLDWPSQPAHAHHCRIITLFNLGHRHVLNFFTYAVNGSGTDGHIHQFQGASSIADGHFHRFLGASGPAIPLADGSHYHEISGTVKDEPFEFKRGSYKTILAIQRHIHSFSGASGTGIGYEPADW